MERRYGTFIPWLLIFGILLGVLIVFPGFKSAFSDVIGYYVVSGSANDIFASLLIGTDINEMIDKSSDMNQKKELTGAAEAIMKICGNKSILINQMNPENFIQIWNLLKPLMTPGMFENLEIKKNLLDLVVLKDNIGEALWYIYTMVAYIWYFIGCINCFSRV